MQRRTIDLNPPKRIDKRWPAPLPPKEKRGIIDQPHKIKFGRPSKGITAVTAPVAKSFITQSMPASFATRGRATVVRHRELIGTVVGQGTTLALNNNSGDVFSINPVDPATFPWLQNIATSYDTYRFVAVDLTYVPLCGTNFVGRVGLFYDRDSTDTGPFDRSELANYAASVETAPWQPTTLSVPVSKTERFIREALSPEAKLYDDGRIGWCTYGTGVGDQCGDLFVSYEVELYNPQPVTSAIESVRASANIGPQYVRSSLFTQNVGSWTGAYRLTTGTFLFNFISNGTTLTAIDYTGTGAITIVANKYLVSNNDRASASGIITVQDTTALLVITVTGTAVTNHQFFVARASRGISINL
jgi:hypothetical protein